MLQVMQELPEEVGGVWILSMLSCKDHLRLDTALVKNEDGRSWFQRALTVGDPVDLGIEVHNSHAWNWYWDRGAHIKEVTLQVSPRVNVMSALRDFAHVEANSNLICKQINLHCGKLVLNVVRLVMPLSVEEASLIVCAVSIHHLIQGLRCTASDGLNILSKVLTQLREVYVPVLSMPGDVAITNILRLNSQLTVLDVGTSFDRSLDPAFYAALAAYGGNLTTLKLKVHREPSSDAHMEAIGRGCRSLEVLRMFYTQDGGTLTSHGIRQLAQGCPRLCNVTLINCSLADTMQAFAEHCPSLKHFCADCPGSLTGPTLAALLHNCPAMVELNNAHLVATAEVVRQHAALFQRLRTIHLLPPWSTDALVAAAKELGKAESVQLASTAQLMAEERVNGAVMEALCQSGCQSLYSLCVKCTATAGLPGALEGLVRCNPALRKLDLYTCAVLSDSLLYALAQSCPQLSTLSAHSVEEGITDEAVEALVQGCPELRFLGQLSGVRLTDRALEALQKICSPTSLEVGSCSHVSDRAIAQLAAKHRTCRIRISQDRTREQLLRALREEGLEADVSIQGTQWTILVARRS